MPKTKLDFWRPKLEGNRLRDERTVDELEARGWTVIEVWECCTKSHDLQQLVAKLQTYNRKPSPRAVFLS